MFTQPCFIRKNTPELRKKLLNIGHTLCRCTEFEDADWLTVSNNKDLYCSVHGLGYTDEVINIPKEDIFNNFLSNTNHIDCGTNEELFLAIAALRDDSDKDQWFTNGTDWAIWREGDSFCGKPITGFEFHYLPSSIDYDSYHKATVKEIIEHFK